MAFKCVVYNPKNADVTVVGVTVPKRSAMGLSVKTSGQFQGLSNAGLFIIPGDAHIEEIQDAGKFMLESGQDLHSRGVTSYPLTA